MGLFGGKKLQELEARVQELTGKLEQEIAEKTSIASQLESAQARVRELEAQLNDFDLEALKEKASATIAEYEGLRDMYTRKNREFDESREEKEEQFARDEAIARHNLDNEIRDNRQANQDYVANTVRTFGESYNYYLNQIKLLMDALGDVASRTGEALFSGENADLKARFGERMRDTLKSGADSLKNDGGDVLLIGGKEPEPEEIEPEEPALFEEASEALAEESADIPGDVDPEAVPTFVIPEEGE